MLFFVSVHLSILLQSRLSINVQQASNKNPFINTYAIEL